VKLSKELRNVRRMLLLGVVASAILVNLHSAAAGITAWCLLMLLVAVYMFDVVHQSIGNPQLLGKTVTLAKLFCRGLRVPEHHNLDNVKGYYAQEQYDWITDVKFPEILLHDRRRVAMSTKTPEYIGDSEVLDLGCGTGLITQVLPGRVTGVDISAWKIERARQHCPRATFVVDDVEELGKLDGSLRFDAVVCTDVLEHLERPDRAVATAWRVLKPGGVLLGTVPTRSVIWKLRRFLTTADSSGEPFHIHYSREMLQKLLESFTLKEISKQCLGLEWFFAAVKKDANEN